ncbi:MAG TPA: glutamine synthetase [Actinobacteria bacterium]|nr:glutamine synthetase [Actinomycetota bacterium]
MNTPEIPGSRDRFARWCEAEGIRTVIAGAADVHGIWRGKRLPLADFLTRIERGVPFSDVVLVITHSEDTDEGQELVEPPGGEAYPLYFPRKEQGFPDIFALPDLATARRLPWHQGTVGVLGDFHLPDGQPVPLDPRVMLRRLIERARSHGLEPKVGIEYEFYIFRGDLAALKESGWRLDPIRVRPYTYGVYGGSLDEELIGEIRHQLAVAGVRIEACNPETGPGQFELNIRYDDALKAADDGFLYKNGIKEIVARHGLMASFMAKPRRDWAGSSCHIHQSLWATDDGVNAFFDHELGRGLSEAGRQYTGGLLSTMREFTALFAPTPNSYKRFAPYSWAGTSVSWSYENRSTGIRAIAEHASESRLEHRLPGADTNPYIAIAACLAGGLHGIEQKIEPSKAYEGDAYATDQLESVPQSLEEAVGLLERSEVAREMLGEDFVQHYVLMKRFEVEKYRQQVSEWEVRRYVEMA